MLGLILLLHFGTFQIVASRCGRALASKQSPSCLAPLRSTSLGEFWGKRWNLGFRQLAHELIFRPLHRKLGADAAGFLVFVVSGLIHDLVISLPARGGYGLPTIYFLLQGAGMTMERSQVRQAARTWAGSAWLVFHDGVPCGTSLLALSPMVCAACDTSFHAGNSRAMTNSLAAAVL